MDYPEDGHCFDLSDEYLIGGGLLAAPLTAAQSERKVYLPAGTWYDFNTNQKLEGGREYTIRPSGSQLPLFVKAGTILPLAQPLEYVPEDYTFDITCYVYGDADTRGLLFEDDGYSFDFEHGAFNEVNLIWKNHTGGLYRKGFYDKPRYTITEWKLIP